MNYAQIKDAACDSAQVPVGTHWFRSGIFANQVLAELGSTYKLALPSAPLVVTPGVGDYSIAAGLGVTNAVQIRDLLYTPVGQLQGNLLEQTSPSRIDEIRARNTSNTYPLQYAVAGVDLLMLGPIPSDAGTLTVRYTADADQMGGDSDVPLTLPAEFHDLVWRGAAIMLIETKPRSSALLAARIARQNERLGDLRSWLRDMAGAKPMRMQRRGDTVPNRDPSIYPVIQTY